MSHRTWALVTDGVRARVLRRLDGADGQDPVAFFDKSEARHLRAQLTAGVHDDRSRNPGADQDDAPRQPGPIQSDMQDFAQEILGRLAAYERAHDLDRLAIFAPPAMLEILRHELPANLRRILLMDRAVNLMTLPEDALRGRVLHLIHDYTNRHCA